MRWSYDRLKRHHQPDFDLVVFDHHRQLARAADQQHGHFGRVDDRRRVRAADRAQVADRERAALQIVERELAAAGLARSTAVSAWAMRGMLIRSTSRITGTTRPRSVSTATPMLTYCL